MKRILIVIFAFVGLASSRSATALQCPPFPEQVAKDWQGEVNATVARIGPVSGGELKTKVQSATQDLLGKLPEGSRLYLEQMMYASYCSALKDDPNLSETVKGERLAEYNREVRKVLQTNPQPQPPHPPKPTPQKLGFSTLGLFRAGSSISEVTESLKDRKSEWGKYNDGQLYVTFPSSLNQLPVQATVFFDHNKRAYRGRFEASRSSNQQPTELCNEELHSLISHITSKIGPLIEPLISSQKAVDPAWDITGGKADFCQYRHATCISRADVATKTAKFEINSGTLDIKAVYVSGYSSATNGSVVRNTELSKCTISIDGNL